MWPGLRPTSAVQSGILIHLAMATIDISRIVGRAVVPPFRGGAAPLTWGSWVPVYNNVAWAEAYLHTKWYVDPSNSLATIHQRHRQTGHTDRQRSDTIGRTVLQTVAEKQKTDFKI